MNTEGKILYVNEAYCRMNNYKRDELIGKSLALILPGQDPQEGLKQYKKIINKEIEKPALVESYNIRRDGTSFPVLISWNYLEDNGKLLGMVTVVQDMTELKKIKKELQQSKYHVVELENILSKREYLEYMMGDSQEIKDVHHAVENVAKTDFSVLICGETGSGKELIAQAIHTFSPREKEVYICVDCGAIPDTLIESELFGHLKGAFTGADRKKEGAFQKAHKGTIFLDEITNLPHAVQQKLLRVLEKKEVQKIGSTKWEKLDIRIVTASNENVKKLVEEGLFRKDLYYRLDEFIIQIPPLRSRKEDVPMLVQRFLNEICIKLKMPQKKISEQSLEVLQKYSWPGNVRELRNSLKRAILLADDIIEPTHFEFYQMGLTKEHAFDIAITFDQEFDLKNLSGRYADSFEKKIILKCLEKFNGNKSKAARFLHIDYKTLLTKIKNYGIHSI